MSPLKIQSFTLVTLSAPFAATGFLMREGAAWGAAFAALFLSVALLALDYTIDKALL